MRFEFIAGALCLDFANTVHDTRAEDKEEELVEVSDLLQWAKEAALLSPAQHNDLAAHYKRNPRQAAAGLAKAVAIRDLLLAIFASLANDRPVSAQRFSELNSALSRFPGLLRIRKDSAKIEAEWRSAAKGIQQILFAVLTSAAELLGSVRSDRVRECASTDCTWLFVDDSRNHSRRWCDMKACGNRMKARRHYQRRRTGTNRGHKSEDHSVSRLRRFGVPDGI